MSVRLSSVLQPFLVSSLSVSSDRCSFFYGLYKLRQRILVTTNLENTEHGEEDYSTCARRLHLSWPP